MHVQQQIWWIIRTFKKNTDGASLQHLPDAHAQCGPVDHGLNLATFRRMHMLSGMHSQQLAVKLMKLSVDWNLQKRKLDCVGQGWNYTCVSLKCPKRLDCKHRKRSWSTQTRCKFLARSHVCQWIASLRSFPDKSDFERPCPHLLRFIFEGSNGTRF